MVTARPSVGLSAIARLGVVYPLLLVACSGPDRLGLSDGFNRPAGGGGGGGGQSSVAPGSGGAFSGGRSGLGGQGTGGGSAEPRDAGGDATSGGSGTGGTLGDGGLRDSGALPDSGASRRCAGVLQANVCWYLGAAGQSCNQACQAHAGFDTASLSSIGIPAQGGSVERCGQVLATLLGNAAGTIQMGTRTDVGVGCHLFGAGRERWWLTQPPFDPSASLLEIQVACGCNE